MKNKRILYTILPIVIFALLWCFRSCGNADTLPNIQLDGNAVNWQGNQQLPHAAQDVKGYAVTGFESLVFTANQTTQKVNFVNPECNTEYLFKMSLLVDDRTLWESSGYCPAGQGYYSIDLSEPLPVGSYTGYLKLEVITTEGRQCNGAKIEFDLIVQEATA